MESFTPQKLEEILRGTSPHYNLHSRFTLAKNFDPTLDISDFEFILEGEECNWYLRKDRVMKGIAT